MQNLSIGVIQSTLIWEDKKANLEHFETAFFQSIDKESYDLILLPEMFNTGFSMNVVALGETMAGDSVKWLKHWAAKLRCSLGGSLIISEEGKYYNRFVVASESGMLTTYDKRHLFRMAQENESFSMGNSRTILELKGWRLMLQVCYDLRFPVFARNTVDAKGNCAYDAVIYIANWPEKRNFIWKNLIQARAIENQAYCIGLNRVGVDGNEINYSGDSRLIDPWGNIITELEAGKQQVASFVLVRKVLEEVRKQFPAFLDSDQFLLIKESTNPTFQ